MTAQPDRPAFPGSYSMGTSVLFPAAGRERRGVVIGATAAGRGEKPRLLVSWLDGAEEETLWLPRELVRLVPDPFLVRARAWIKSFLFGEK